MSELRVTEAAGAARFAVRVQPRAGRSGVAGLHDGALKVRLAAAPVDGAANEELLEVLGEWLGVPRRQVRIVSGETARQKVVEVAGASAEQVRARAAAL